MKLSSLKRSNRFLREGGRQAAGEGISGNPGLASRELQGTASDQPLSVQPLGCLRQPLPPARTHPCDLRRTCSAAMDSIVISAMAPPMLAITMPAISAPFSPLALLLLPPG